jgi:hypothetical protein
MDAILVRALNTSQQLIDSERQTHESSRQQMISEIERLTKQVNTYESLISSINLTRTILETIDTFIHDVMVCSPNETPDEKVLFRVYKEWCLFNPDRPRIQKKQFTALIQLGVFNNKRLYTDCSDPV